MHWYNSVISSIMVQWYNSVISSIMVQWYNGNSTENEVPFSFFTLLINFRGCTTPNFFFDDAI